MRREGEILMTMLFIALSLLVFGAFVFFAILAGMAGV